MEELKTTIQPKIKLSNWSLEEKAEQNKPQLIGYHHSHKHFYILYSALATKKEENSNNQHKRKFCLFVTFKTMKIERMCSNHHHRDLDLIGQIENMAKQRVTNSLFH